MLTLRELTAGQKRATAAQRRAGTIPADCETCQHYAERLGECRVLVVMIEDCFVIRQARRNRARGIEALP